MILFKEIQLSFSIRRYLWVAVLLGYSAAASAQGKPTFEAAADARQILLNSFVEVSFTLTNAEGKNFQPPAFKDFTVVSGPNRSVSTSLINGQFSTSAGYAYTLKPRRLGKLTIDPAGIRVDNRTLYTQKLEIEVLDSRQASSTAGEPFYMQAEAKPTRAWIGQQVLLDYKLYAEDHVGSFNPIGESKYDGFYVEEIRRFDAPWQREIVNKRQYHTKVLKRMALYPQRSGALQVDPYEVQLNILGDDPGGLSLFMPRPVKRIPAATPPAVIQVQPLPQPAPASFSGAVGHYKAVFGANLNDLTTDDALSLTIAVEGDGDIKRLQAPPIDFPESFEVYPPKVLEDRTFEENGRIIGKKVFEYLLVPREAGIFTIAPTFVYFDIDSAKYATISADPITLNVSQGQLNKSGVTPTKIQAADSEILPLKTLSARSAYHFSLWVNHWLWIGLVLPLLALSMAWLLKRRQQRVEGRNSLEYQSQRARKTAIARLSTAKAHLDAGQSRPFYDEIEKGLVAYLGYKFDIPPAAWSKTLARQRMEEAGVDAALVAAFSQVVQTCEMALFAAKDQATDMQATYSAAANIIEKLEGLGERG